MTLRNGQERRPGDKIDVLVERAREQKSLPVILGRK